MIDGSNASVSRSVVRSSSGDRLGKVEKTVAPSSSKSLSKSASRDALGSASGSRADNTSRSPSPARSVARSGAPSRAPSPAAAVSSTSRLVPSSATETATAMKRKKRISDVGMLSSDDPGQSYTVKRVETRGYESDRNVKTGSSPPINPTPTKVLKGKDWMYNFGVMMFIIISLLLATSALDLAKEVEDQKRLLKRQKKLIEKLRGSGSGNKSKGKYDVTL